MRLWSSAVVLPALLSVASAAVAAAPSPSRAHAVALDGYSFRIDGNRVYLWSAEFHPFRLPSPALWRDVFQKMRAAGFNTTSIYFSWGYHSPSRGVYDFTGVRDMDLLLDIASEVGLYVIARPGPYINAEVDSGGFPLWMTRERVDNRSADPAYLALADEWMSRIDAIIARHQWTNGQGTVIAYQIENEFYRGDTPGGRDYIAHLERKAIADGITVPLIGNHNANFAGGRGRLAVDGWDYYPQGFDCSHPGEWKPVPDMAFNRVPGQPLMTPEFQGGAFDPWGGPGYAKCARLINDQFASVFYKANIAAGATAQNFYMGFGGTSWGWQAIPQNYTSYDYGAAITEARQFDAKYAEDKLIGYMTRASPSLLETNGTAPAQVDDAAIVDTARRNPVDGSQFHFLHHADTTATSDVRVHLDLMIAGRPYHGIPRAPGASIRINGRQGKILLADHPLGPVRLVYSTSELMTQAEIAGRSVVVLYGDSGEPGETVLRMPGHPRVAVLEGVVQQAWEDGDLRLDYRHAGLVRVLVSGGGLNRPMLLLLADKDEAVRFWQLSTARGPVLVRGGHLLRTATADKKGLALTGDIGGDGALEIFSGAGSIRWNGHVVTARPTTSGSVSANVPTARSISLPRLRWQMRREGPEIAPSFDDRKWTIADRQDTASITRPGTRPILFADDYGFHTGNIWYRSHFALGPGAKAPAGLRLRAISGGTAGALSAWLNGTFLGTIQGEKLEQRFALPAGAFKSGDNVLSVLTVNMGHDEDYDIRNQNRTARGLVLAELDGGEAVQPTWRIQGADGGEHLPDPVRGPFNNGGLYGERVGWALSRDPGRGWTPVSLPAGRSAPGVAWYRSRFRLSLPRDQDTSLGLTFRSDAGAHYRAIIFVNGWQVGNYISDLGPQHDFPVPNGILDTNGGNTVAIAVWTTQASAGLGKVALANFGSYRTSTTWMTLTRNHLGPR